MDDDGDCNPCSSSSRSRGRATRRLSFEIAEGGIDDMVSELAGKGVTIVTPVSHAPGGWSAEIKDPEGQCPYHVPVSGQAAKTLISAHRSRGSATGAIRLGENGR